MCVSCANVRLNPLCSPRLRVRLDWRGSRGWLAGWLAGGGGGGGYAVQVAGLKRGAHVVVSVALAAVMWKRTRPGGIGKSENAPLSSSSASFFAAQRAGSGPYLSTGGASTAPFGL